jgi:uncharacterized protein YcbX
MRGEELQEAFVGFPGVYGDRQHAFCSSTAQKGFPWLTGREQESMLLYRPRYRHAERAARPANLAEAELLGSVGATPIYGDLSDFALDVETPAGERLAIDDPRLASLLRENVRDSPRLTLLQSSRAMTDCRPVSIISLQTVRQLGKELAMEMDKLRFRANFYVELESGKAFGEDEFVGRTLQVGAKAAIAVVKRDSRCKMITLDPGTAQANPEIMKLLARDHEGHAGIYGVVLTEGIVRPGDEIALQD